VGWYLQHYLREIIAGSSAMIEQSLPKLAEFMRQHHMSFPIGSTEELRGVLTRAVKDHAMSITSAGGIVTRSIIEALMGVFVAVLTFLGRGDPAVLDRSNLYGSAFTAFGERLRAFRASFETVLGVQGTIAVINTVVTAAFVVACGFPHAPFLITATLIFSMIPILGNLLGNTLIVTVGLTVSVKMGVAALVYLVVAHKLEYLLNSRIVGARIKTPMWLTILGMIAGEALLGLPGVVLAPALIHYLRAEMQAIKANN
jgi:predicted PurR-regulated permease PerM